jgi:hypothetical protein
MNVVNVVPMPTSSRPPPPRQHVSVLAREIVEHVAPRSNGIYVDCTLGAGRSRCGS